MGYFSSEYQTLTWQENQQKVWLRPWGKNSLRVPANLAGRPLDRPQALLEIAGVHGHGIDVAIHLADGEATISNGSLQALVSADGRIRYLHAPSGRVLLAEPEPACTGPYSRHFKHRAGGLYQIESSFLAQEDERFHRLGQRSVAPAPLDTIPVYVRAGSGLVSAFR
jgi:alpha-D-xyloside xylohydrolase